MVCTRKGLMEYFGDAVFELPKVLMEKFRISPSAPWAARRQHHQSIPWGPFWCKPCHRNPIAAGQTQPAGQTAGRAGTLPWAPVGAHWTLRDCHHTACRMPDTCHPSKFGCGCFSFLQWLALLLQRLYLAKHLLEAFLLRGWCHLLWTVQPVRHDAAVWSPS